jgi:hypothetical protein
MLRAVLFAQLLYVSNYHPMTNSELSLRLAWLPVSLSTSLCFSDHDSITRSQRSAQIMAGPCGWVLSASPYFISLSPSSGRLAGLGILSLSSTQKSGAPFVGELRQIRGSPWDSFALSFPLQLLFSHHFTSKVSFCLGSSCSFTHLQLKSLTVIRTCSPLRFSRMVLTRLVSKTVLHPARPVGFTLPTMLNQLNPPRTYLLAYRTLS